MNATIASTDTIDLNDAVPDTALSDGDGRQDQPAPSFESAGNFASSDSICDITINEKVFGIRLADTDEGRNSASYLINKMYTWRGYTGTHRIEQRPNRITLSASNHGDVMGTVTLSIDSTLGLLADEIFRDQLDQLRQRGGKVCEITKLAFDPTVQSKAAQAALFHILFMYARHLHQCTDVVIEINPRHRRFYQTMLGFRQLCEMRHNTRVDAPAYLLWASLDDIDREIKRLGGTGSNAANERSLYPYFFSQKEEEGITRRLMSLG